MALANPALPYGVRDIKLSQMIADGTYLTAVDLPAARTLSFSESEDFTELRGDDTVKATRGNGSTLEWELEAGGLSLAAYKILAGGAVVQSGTTPNLKDTYTKLGADARPYFKIEGQVISDAGGDVHLVIYKAKTTENVEGEFSDGEFMVTGASGVGIAHGTSDKIYELVHNETAAAIV